MDQLTRFRVLMAGASAVGLAVIVEVVGVLYANGILQHNVYGFTGGILAVLGIVTISVSRAEKSPTAN